jgi:outer membrane lipase/esterase
VIGAVAANPSSFGFIAGGGPACIRPLGLLSGYAILCTPLTLVASDAPQTHLFADDVHLSTAGQKVLADYEYSLVVATGMISMLAEAPLKTRAGLVGTIQNQIRLSESQRGPLGFNTWVSGDIGSLRTSKHPGFLDQSGTPAVLTAGVDYRIAKDFLVGAALSGGRQRADFSGSFGGFTQTELSVSLYGSGAIGPVWFDTVATYGSISYDIRRNVPVGITLQNNTASASASNISLAGETGYNLYSGSIVHGPLAGVVLQQVHVGAFTESGSFTSLGFASQTRNSALSEVGYQAAFRFGFFSPFVKAVWNHEFVDSDRQVSASLTTAAAPAYSMPAVQLGSDWGTVTAGTAVKLAGNVNGLVAITGSLAQQSVQFGGQVGINVSF